MIGPRIHHRPSQRQPVASVIGERGVAADSMRETAFGGESPESSVVNRWNQAWDVPNLFIVDGSTFATGGVVNPTPTVSALALRAAEHLRDNFRELRSATRPLAA